MTSDLPAAVLWDMDGTLVDTEPHWRDAQRELFEEHGIPHLTPEQEAALVGADMHEAATGFAEVHGLPLHPSVLVGRICDRVLELTRLSLPWRPGARELLDALGAAGVPCALVTNSVPLLVDALLEAIGRDPFAAIVTADDVERAKPAPDPYVLAAARLGLDPAECIVLEDSNHGLEAATAAGCRAIGIPHHLEIPASTRYATIPTLEGVTPAALARIAAGIPAFAPWAAS